MARLAAGAGDLLCRQRRYQEAAERLAEAIRRYPDDPESINARYLLAECHRAEAERLRGSSTRSAWKACGGRTSAGSASA